MAQTLDDLINYHSFRLSIDRVSFGSDEEFRSALSNALLDDNEMPLAYGILINKNPSDFDSSDRLKVLELRQNKSAQTELDLQESGDSYLGISYSDYLSILSENGFTEVYGESIEGSDDSYKVFSNTTYGMLLTAEEFSPQREMTSIVGDSIVVCYASAKKNDYSKFYREISTMVTLLNDIHDGTNDLEVEFSGKEGLLHSISCLSQKPITFLNPWPSQVKHSSLPLLNYFEIEKYPLGIHSETRHQKVIEKIGKFPQETQQMIGYTNS